LKPELSVRVRVVDVVVIPEAPRVVPIPTTKGRCLWEILSFPVSVNPPLDP